MQETSHLIKEDLRKISSGFRSTLKSFHCYFFSNPDFDRVKLHKILDSEIDDLISCEGYNFYREKEVSDHPRDRVEVHNGVETIVGPVQTPCG